MVLSGIQPQLDFEGSSENSQLCCRVDPVIPSAIDDLSFLEEREERERSRGTVTFSVKATPIC